VNGRLTKQPPKALLALVRLRAISVINLPTGKQLSLEKEERQEQIAHIHRFLTLLFTYKFFVGKIVNLAGK